jgi:ABC-type uncharacterized transport system substrate-binding protein
VAALAQQQATAGDRIPQRSIARRCYLCGGGVPAAATEREIDETFAMLAERRVSSLMVASDPFFNGRRPQIVAPATRLAVLQSFISAKFVLDGGLMSYGTSVTDMYRLAANYTGRILRGAKPADLPVQQSTKSELVINLKTAKSLGFTIALRVVALVGSGCPFSVSYGNEALNCLSVWS